MRGFLGGRNSDIINHMKFLIMKNWMNVFHLTILAISGFNQEITIPLTRRLLLVYH